MIDPDRDVEEIVLLEADAELVPAAFVAVTVNVYEVPLVKPVTRCEREVLPALESVPPAGCEVTV